MMATRLLAVVVGVGVFLLFATGSAMAVPDEAADPAPADPVPVDDGDDVGTSGADLINDNVGPPAAVPAGNGQGTDAGGGDDDVGTTGADLIND